VLIIKKTKSKNKPMKIYKPMIIILVLFLSSANNFYCKDDDKKNTQDIAINTYYNLSIGDVIKGATKSNFIENQVIKFEIQSKSNRNIRVIRIKDAGNDFIRFKTEWKVGPYTGFEELFTGNGIYSLENKTLYVTMTIKSIEVLSSAPTGVYSFSPEISVEYIDF
jgi:hypothetical protein